MRQADLTLKGIAALLVALTLVAYLPLLDNRAFVFDDVPYVVENQPVRDGLTWHGTSWAFTTLERSNWHPLTWMSLMLDVQLFGVDARAMHIVNLLLHVLNAVLVLVGLWKLTGALWPGAAAAALFAVHPLHVESVAWITERKDVLSTLLGLLAIGAWASWTRSGRRRPYAAALLLYGASLMAKPMLVTLPFILLLLDWWPLGRLRFDTRETRPGQAGPVRRWALLGEKLPFLALAAASSAITVIAQSRGRAVVLLEHLGLPDRLANALLACQGYLRKTVWPADLAAFYTFPTQRPHDWNVAGAAVLIAAIAAGALAFRRRAPVILAGWLFYLGTLVPVIGIVQIGDQSMADRYTYVPLLGLFVPAGWAVGHLARAPGWRRRAVLAGAAGALIALVVATADQAETWGDSGTLWRHATAVTRNNYVAHANLGAWLAKQGRIGEALIEYEHSLDIFPNYSVAHYGAAWALSELGRLDEAERHARAAVASEPDLIRNRMLLGGLLLHTGRHAGAVEQYSRVLELDPANPEAQLALGQALEGMGDTRLAEVRYREALRLKPGLADASNALAVLLGRGGRVAEAVTELRAALSMSPDNPRLHYNLGTSLDLLGATPEAIACYREALRLNPGLVEAHNNLALGLLATGNAAGAVDHLHEAIRLDPGYREARVNLDLIKASGAGAGTRNPGRFSR